ncbi:MAG: hypothetical protein A2178_01620 [Planctomycetes bacterium GWC2_49_10]|nr:MAG: hypothetical protein A2178_01620 [Planctomycetes bacterium GWC2_49_10]
MRKKIVISLFLLAAFIGYGYLPAHADRKGCDKKKGACDISEKLKLTKEQKAKVEEMRDECRKSRIKADAEIETIRIDLKALLRNESIDKGAVDAKVNELGDLIKKEVKAKYDCKIKTISLLDAEQKKVFLESDDCCGMGEGRHHKWYGKGGRGGCDIKEKKKQGEEKEEGRRK